MEHEISQKNIGFDLIREAARRGSRTVRIPKIPFLTSERFKDTLGGITIAPELMEHIPIPYKLGKSIFFTGFDLSASNLSLRTDSFQVERKARKDDRLSSSHHSIWRNIPAQKNPVMTSQFLKKCTITAIGNVIRMLFIG